MFQQFGMMLLSSRKLRQRYNSKPSLKWILAFGDDSYISFYCLSQDDNETERNGEMMNKKSKKGKNKGKFSLKEIYEKKHEEEEKARMEREAIIQKQKEERENAKARRKAAKEKMYKKTRSGQPVMKYRIERLLETIQGSKSNNSW